MKNILSLFFLCFCVKFASAVTVNVNRAKAQSPFISQGNSINTVGDIPSMADSVSQLGSPFVDYVQVFVRSEKQRYYAFGGNWFKVTALDPSKMTQSEADARYMPMNDTVPSGNIMTKTGANNAVQAIKDKEAIDSSMFMSGINARVKYTDTAAMLVPYARTSVVNAALAGKFNNPSGTSLQYIKGDGTLGTYSTGSGTVTSVGLSSTDFTVSGSPVTSSGNITANLNASGVSAGTYNIVTVNTKGIVTSAANRTVNNAPGRSIVTTAAAANGWQVSATRQADVRYSVTIGTTVSLAGNSSGYVVLEVAPTNSTTASDWVEVARITNGQSGTLVVGLTLNQVGGAPLVGTVPAGHYVRQRSVNVSGTPTYTTNGQQEVF